MEADHRQPAARLQEVDRGGQRILECGQLVVDGDAEGLEDALRRVSVAEAGRRRDRILDRLDELAGPFERLLPPPARDCAGNLLRIALFAVLAKDVGQLRARKASLTSSRAE
jgi:hypothetical protein